jgi:hypothetical protein
MRRVKIGCVVLLISLSLALPLYACSVPVFRYALERWPVDAYRLVIFHQGPLSETEEALQSQLEAFSEMGYGRPPLMMQAVDTADAMPERLTAIWEEVKEASLPRMVLLSPEMGEEDVVLWNASLRDENVTLLTESPVRRTLLERLTEGETAVWLLLRSGDPVKDAAVTKALEEGLAEMEATLKLPHELDPTDTEYDTGLTEEIELKIDFSILPMDMSDPAEAILASVFADIVTGEDGPLLPAVVPVFGRGRALIFLDQADVVLDTIAELSQFLVGPCSCQVKQLNPGIDLPVFADWDARIMGMIGDEALPTDLLVPGALPDFESDSAAAVTSAPAVADAADATESHGVAETTDTNDVDVVAVAEVAESPADTNSPDLSDPPASPMGRSLLVVALLGLLAVGGGTAFLLKGS